MHSLRALKILQGVIWGFAAINLGQSTFSLIFQAYHGTFTAPFTSWMALFQGVVSVLTLEALFAVCLYWAGKGNVTARKISYALLGVSTVSLLLKVYQGTSWLDLPSALQSIMQLAVGILSPIGIAVLSYMRRDTVEPAPANFEIVLEEHRSTTLNMVRQIVNEQKLALPQTDPAPKLQSGISDNRFPAGNVDEKVAEVLSRFPSATSKQVKEELDKNGLNVSTARVRQTTAWSNRKDHSPTPGNE